MPEPGSESTNQARAAMCEGRIGTQKPRHSDDNSDHMWTKRSRNGLRVNLAEPMLRPLGWPSLGVNQPLTDERKIIIASRQRLDPALPEMETPLRSVRGHRGQGHRRHRRWCHRPGAISKRWTHCNWASCRHSRFSRTSVPPEWQVPRPTAAYIRSMRYLPTVDHRRAASRARGSALRARPWVREQLVATLTIECVVQSEALSNIADESVRRRWSRRIPLPL